MELLDVQNVVKRYRTTTAVNNVSFSVKPGSIFGLLGPNGAGKTTLIRMITNITMPDEGSIRLFGEQMSPALQNKLGYLPEERGLYKKIKVGEQLSYFAQLKGLSRAEAYQRSQYWLHRLEASGWENKKIEELSKGMQQKIQFISTILHDPDLIILDEPFTGFDPVNSEMLTQSILDLKNQGKTIILSTHRMEQVEKLCDDIVLINHGTAVLSGSVRQIKSSRRRDGILLEFTGDDSFLDEMPDVKVLSRSSHQAELRLSGSVTSPRQVLEQAMKSAEIHKFEVIEPSLNEIFIETVSPQEVIL